MGKRTGYTAEFKAKGALATQKEQMTISELVHCFGVNVMTINKRKHNFIFNSSKTFKEIIRNQRMTEKKRFKNFMLRYLY
jgi:hypothetical protein